MNNLIGINFPDRLFLDEDKNPVSNDFINETIAILSRELRKVIFRTKKFPLEGEKFIPAIQFEEEPISFLSKRELSDQIAFQNDPTKNTIAIQPVFHFPRNYHFGTERFLPKLQEIIPYLQKLNISIIVVHPPKEMEQTLDEYVQAIVEDTPWDILKKENLILCLENLPGTKYFSDLENIGEILTKVHKKLSDSGRMELKQNFRLCLDIGHFLIHTFRTGNPPESILRSFLGKFNQNIEVLHLHVNDGTSDQHMLLGSLIGKKEIEDLNLRRLYQNKKLVLKLISTLKNYYPKPRCYIFECKTPYPIENLHRNFLNFFAAWTSGKNLWDSAGIDSRKELPDIAYPDIRNFILQKLEESEFIKQSSIFQEFGGKYENDVQFVLEDLKGNGIISIFQIQNVDRKPQEFICLFKNRLEVVRKIHDYQEFLEKTLWIEDFILNREKGVSLEEIWKRFEDKKMDDIKLSLDTLIEFGRIAKLREDGVEKFFPDSEKNRSSTRIRTLYNQILSFIVKERVSTFDQIFAVCKTKFRIDITARSLRIVLNNLSKQKKIRILQDPPELILYIPADMTDSTVETICIENRIPSWISIQHFLDDRKVVSEEDIRQYFGEAIEKYTQLGVLEKIITQKQMSSEIRKVKFPGFGASYLYLPNLDLDYVRNVIEGLPDFDANRLTTTEKEIQMIENFIRQNDIFSFQKFIDRCRPSLSVDEVSTILQEEPLLNYRYEGPGVEIYFKSSIPANEIDARLRKGGLLLAKDIAECFAEYGFRSISDNTIRNYLVSQYPDLDSKQLGTRLVELKDIGILSMEPAESLGGSGTHWKLNTRECPNMAIHRSELEKHAFTKIAEDCLKIAQKVEYLKNGNLTIKELYGFSADLIRDWDENIIENLPISPRERLELSNMSLLRENESFQDLKYEDQQFLQNLWANVYRNASICAKQGMAEC